MVADADVAAGRWQPALVDLLRAGDVAAAQGLIEAVGLDARHPGTGTSIAHHLALRGDVDLLGWAIDRGADLRARNDRGDTPLVFAAWGGHRAVLERIVELTGIPSEGELQRALTHCVLGCEAATLTFADEGGAVEVARRLLGWGARAAAPCAGLAEGEQLLDALVFRAASRPSFDARVELLLEHGASPDAMVMGGSQHALPHVLAAGRAELAEILIRHGATVAVARGACGPLHALAERDADAAAIARWIARGCAIDAELTNGHTPLSLAVQGGHLRAAAALRQAGARIDHEVAGKNLHTLALLADQADALALVESWGIPPQPEHRAEYEALVAARARAAAAHAGRVAGTIVGGAFAGMKASAEVGAAGPTRKVLVELFGKNVAVEVPAADFVPDA